MNPQKDHSQLTFVNVLDEAGRKVSPKKSSDLFNTRIVYRTSQPSVEKKTLIIYIGDWVCNQFELSIGDRVSIVRVTDQPYRIGIVKDSDGIKVTPKKYKNDYDRADQIGGYHDAMIQTKLDGLKVPHTEGERVQPCFWEVVDHTDSSVLLVDLPEDQIYIDHIIETK